MSAVKSLTCKASFEDTGTMLLLFMSTTALLSREMNVLFSSVANVIIRFMSFKSLSDISITSSVPSDDNVSLLDDSCTFRPNLVWEFCIVRELVFSESLSTVSSNLRIS